jgi:hypothetical protein
LFKKTYATCFVTGVKKIIEVKTSDLKLTNILADISIYCKIIQKIFATFSKKFNFLSKKIEKFKIRNNTFLAISNFFKPKSTSF